MRGAGAKVLNDSRGRPERAGGNFRDIQTATLPSEPAPSGLWSVCSASPLDLGFETPQPALEHDVERLPKCAAQDAGD